LFILLKSIVVVGYNAVKVNVKIGLTRLSIYCLKQKQNSRFSILPEKYFVVFLIPYIYCSYLMKELNQWGAEHRNKKKILNRNNNKKTNNEKKHDAIFVAFSL
jgi:hypothetical protein